MIALNATFFTATIEKSDRDSEGDDPILPGDYDPATGGAIFSSLYEILLNTPFDSPLWQSLSNMAERINRNWSRMIRDIEVIYGYGYPWYYTLHQP